MRKRTFTKLLICQKCNKRFYNLKDFFKHLKEHKKQINDFNLLVKIINIL